MHLTEKRLNEIKARVEKASGFPWLRKKTTIARDAIKGHRIIGDMAIGTVCIVNFGNDAEFIVNSRQDIPDLIAEVQRLKKQVDWARGCIHGVIGCDEVCEKRLHDVEKR